MFLRAVSVYLSVLPFVLWDSHFRYPCCSSDTAWNPINATPSLYPAPYRTTTITIWEPAARSAAGHPLYFAAFTANLAGPKLAFCNETHVGGAAPVSKNKREQACALDMALCRRYACMNLIQRATLVSLARRLWCCQVAPRRRCGSLSTVLWC